VDGEDRVPLAMTAIMAGVSEHWLLIADS